MASERLSWHCCIRAKSQTHQLGGGAYSGSGGFSSKGKTRGSLKGEEVCLHGKSTHIEWTLWQLLRGGGRWATGASQKGSRLAEMV